MDFIVDLPESNGYKNILVITDRLTKGPVYIPMDKMDSATVATALIQNVFSHHLLPRAIVSDRGSQFVGMVWKKVCEHLKIKRLLSTAFHPQTDGATERENAELETYLRAFCAYAQNDWASWLPIAQMARINRVSSSTGMSPFFMTHGYNGAVIDEKEPDLRTQRPAKSPIAQGNEIVEKLSTAQKMAQAAMAAAQDAQERAANRSRRDHARYEVGDGVYLKLKNIRTDRPSKKLDWIAAPYRILEKMGTHTYRLDTPPGIHPVFHASLLKSKASDPLESQTREHVEMPPIFPGTESEEYEVERILKERRKGTELLVKWVGWVKPTWEPRSEFENTAALDQWEQLG